MIKEVKLKKILIIKWGALGDILAATPTILRIKSFFPDSKITFLSTKLAKEVFKNSNIIDETIDRKQRVVSTLFYLRKKRFDIVLNLQWGSEAADLYSFFSGAGVTIGGSVKSYLRCLYDYKPPFLETDINRHEYLKNLDILSSYKKDSSDEVDAFIPVEESARLNYFLKNKEDYIVVSPSASTLKKAWIKEKYIELCRLIIKKHQYNVIISYAPEDKEYAEHIVTKIGDGAHLAIPTNINEVAFLVKKAKLCICNNSGIMHVAYAVKTPVMCFNTSIGWHPFGKNDISIDRIPSDLKDNRSLHNDRVEKLLETVSVEEAYLKFKAFHCSG